MKLFIYSTLITGALISVANAHCLGHHNQVEHYNHGLFFSQNTATAPIVSPNTIGRPNNFFIDTNESAVSKVSDIKKMKDDDLITLEGSIVKQIDDDEFIFKDKTGEIQIDIDDKLIRSMSDARITPQNVLRITGKLDKEFMEKDKVDVYRLDILR